VTYNAKLSLSPSFVEPTRSLNETLKYQQSNTDDIDKNKAQPPRNIHIIDIHTVAKIVLYSFIWSSELELGIEFNGRSQVKE